MAIILRRTKGSTLTHDELDDNFQQLSISNLDSAKVKAMIDSDFVQIRVPETYLATIIDSDYVENRVTHRDSAFVTGIVDSAYILGIAPAQDFLDSSEVINLVDSAYVQSRVTLRDSSFITGLIDSDYISNRSSSSGGLGGIEFSSTSSSVTKVGDGDVLVELSGGGGAKGYAIIPGGSGGGKGGNSNGRGVLNNVADGSIITFTIGAGGSGSAGGTTYGATGGSTTVYVDSANGQKLVITGGAGGTPESLGGNTGSTATTPTASGGATALTGHGLIQSPLGQGAQSGAGGTAGSNGCILLIGV